MSAPSPVWILVVDDDPDFREIASRMLRQAGYATREAATGEEAIESARRDAPDLVVLDVRLGGALSGHDVCRLLKEEIFPEPAVIFVSGALVDPNDRASGLLIGADDYIVKPFEADEFIARIRALIRRAASNVMPDLTHVEREVARLLKQGIAETEVAQRLNMPPAMARSIVEGLFSKMGV